MLLYLYFVMKKYDGIVFIICIELLTEFDFRGNHLILQGNLANTHCSFIKNIKIAKKHSGPRLNSTR